MNNNKIDLAFITHASEILVDTTRGLRSGQIVKCSNAYSVQFNVSILITDSNFGKFGSIVPNKRTALQKNLIEFNGNQQFLIIKELCELPIFSDNKEVQ